MLRYFVLRCDIPGFRRASPICANACARRLAPGGSLTQLNIERNPEGRGVKRRCLPVSCRVFSELLEGVKWRDTSDAPRRPLSTEDPSRDRRNRHVCSDTGEQRIQTVANRHYLLGPGWAELENRRSGAGSGRSGPCARRHHHLKSGQLLNTAFTAVLNRSNASGPSIISGGTSSFRPQIYGILHQLIRESVSFPNLSQ